MKKRYLIIILFLLLILDTSFAPFLSINEVYPSFLLTFAVAYSIINKPKDGIIIGIITGVLQDIFFSQAFGVNTLVNMWICLCAGLIGQGIWKEKKLIPIVTIFIGSIFKYLGVFIVLNMINIKVNLDKSIYFAIYNSVLMIIMYGKLYRTCKRDDNEFSWRFKER